MKTRLKGIFTGLLLILALVLALTGVAAAEQGAEAVSEIPVLTLASDFPIEVEKQVAASGLSPTTSYRFGQRSPDDENEAEDESESTDSGKDGEKSNGGDESAVKTAMN